MDANGPGMTRPGGANHPAADVLGLCICSIALDHGKLRIMGCSAVLTHLD